MKRTHHPSAFTLIELMVSAALMALIMSILYASYVGVSHVTERRLDSISHRIQTELALDQLAQQLRCCFPMTRESSHHQPDPNRPRRSPYLSGQPVSTPATHDASFSANANHPSGEILRFVTTRPLSPGAFYFPALYRTTLRWDRSRRSLSIRQQSLGQPVSEWQRLLTEVESLTLRFLDQGQWQAGWRERPSVPLPQAIEIVLETKDGHQKRTRYRRIIHPTCAVNQNLKMKNQSRS